MIGSLFVTGGPLLSWREGCTGCAVVKPVVLLAAILLAACQREERAFDTQSYNESAWFISEGKELYSGMNCDGCHGRGGGDLGPPLLDKTWRYGSSPAAVMSSILDGRPLGMPAFKTKLSGDDAAKLAAYVRSLAGLVRMDSQSPRDDHLAPPARHP